RRMRERERPLADRDADALAAHVERDDRLHRLRGQFVDEGAGFRTASEVPGDEVVRGSRDAQRRAEARARAALGAQRAKVRDVLRLQRVRVPAGAVAALAAEPAGLEIEPGAVLVEAVAAAHARVVGGREPERVEQPQLETRDERGRLRRAGDRTDRPTEERV